MKKTKIALLTGALVAGPALATVDAVVDSFSPPSIVQMGQTVTTATTAAVTTPLSTVIGNAMNGLKTILVTAQQNAASNAQQGANGRQALDYQTQVTSATAPAPDACASASTAAAAAPVSQNYAYYKSAASYRGAFRAGNAGAAPDQKRQVQSNHFNYYCDPNTDPSKCANAPAPQGNGSTKNEAMVSADERATSLFGGAGAVGHVENLTYTAKQQQAAQDYITNAVDGTDAPRKLSAAEYNTPQGQQYEGLRVAYESRMSLSRDALEFVLAARTPIVGSHQAVADMANGDLATGQPPTAITASASNYVKSKLNDPTNGILLYSPSGDVSAMQLLDLEIGRRADNPDWYAAINSTADTNALLRELVFMSALQLKMQYRSLREQEFTAAIQAVNAAETTKLNMHTQLTQAETAVMQGVESK